VPHRSYLDLEREVRDARDRLSQGERAGEDAERGRNVRFVSEGFVREALEVADQFVAFHGGSSRAWNTLCADKEPIRGFLIRRFTSRREKRPRRPVQVRVLRFAYNASTASEALHPRQDRQVR
jgi:hypothetical protein